MEDAKLESNLGEIKKDLPKIPYRAKLALADGLDHATRSFYAYFYRTRMQGRPGLKGKRGGLFTRFRRVTTVNGKKVFLRTQASQSESVRAIAKSAKDPLKMRVEMYSTSKVADIHERGGALSSNSFMRIPLNAEAQKLNKTKGYIPNTFLLNDNGKLFIAREQGSSKVQLLFILKRNVNVIPRLGFYRSWDTHSSRRAEVIEDAWDKAIEKVLDA